MKKAIEKELKVLSKKRAAYLKQYEKKRELAPELEKKIPPTLKKTLNTAFVKAFELIYKKGSKLIDKTFSKENAQQQYEINRFAWHIKQNRRTLRAFYRKSNASGAVNMLISGVEGIGLGLLGCGLPDIPLLTAVILRSLYEISTHYGYDYTLPEERGYQLLIIRGAMSYGEDLRECMDRLDSYAKKLPAVTGYEMKEEIEEAATALAEEMLFLKFVQGIPVVGVVGGISDAVFLQRIQRFAIMNYQYRMVNGFSES